MLYSAPTDKIVMSAGGQSQCKKEIITCRTMIRPGEIQANDIVFQFANSFSDIRSGLSV